MQHCLLWQLEIIRVGVHTMEYQHLKHGDKTGLFYVSKNETIPRHAKVNFIKPSTREAVLGAASDCGCPGVLATPPPRGCSLCPFRAALTEALQSRLFARPCVSIKICREILTPLVKVAVPFPLDSPVTLPLVSSDIGAATGILGIWLRGMWVADTRLTGFVG